MPFQRVWTYQFSGSPGGVLANTKGALQQVLDQFADTGEVLTVTQTLIADPTNAKVANAVLLSTTLVYRVPTADTAFDFEG